MLWVYYSAQILLFGAALASTIDLRHGGDTAPKNRQPGQPGLPAAPPTSLAEARARRLARALRPLDARQTTRGRAARCRSCASRETGRAPGRQRAREQVSARSLAA
jgi:hypothetical protein